MDEVVDFIIIRAEIADELTVMIERHIKEALDALPFEIIVVNRVILFEDFDVFNQNAGRRFQTSRSRNPLHY